MANTLDWVKKNTKICGDIKSDMYWKCRRKFKMCNPKFWGGTQADHATKNPEFEKSMRLEDDIFNKYMSTFFTRVFSVCFDEDMYKKKIQ